MQNQSAQLTLQSHVGFVYDGANRLFSCLGQVFSNVAIFEIEQYREIAIRNHNHNNRPREKPRAVVTKNTQSTQRPAVKQADKKQAAKPGNKHTKHTKHPAKKPNHAKSGPQKIN